MKKPRPLQLIPILAFLTAVCACSTAQHGPPGFNASQVSQNPSEFEITYSLGERGQHRLKGSSTEGPRLAAYLERSIIEERNVSDASYARYLAKLVAFTRNRAQRAPSQDHECRSPYSITVKIDGKTYSSKGCRGQRDDTSFSQLLREGEFLLYSKK